MRPWDALHPSRYAPAAPAADEPLPCPWPGPRNGRGCSVSSPPRPRPGLLPPAGAPARAPPRLPGVIDAGQELLHGAKAAGSHLGFTQPKALTNLGVRQAFAVVPPDELALRLAQAVEAGLHLFRTLQSAQEVRRLRAFGTLT